MDQDFADGAAFDGIMGVRGPLEGKPMESKPGVLSDCERPVCDRDGDVGYSH